MSSFRIPNTVLPRTPSLWPPGLWEQYRSHALTVRGVVEETVDEEFLYLNRLFDYLGSFDTAVVLFDKISPVAITEFLVQYAQSHGPGSRRWMQHSLRSFLRFAYQHSFIDRDLSDLVPAVRVRKLGRIPRVLPEECIAALGTGIQRNNSAGLRDSAIICLLRTYGVRGVQIRRLRLDHLDWESCRIHFPAAKGGRPIEQYLTPEAGNHLADYITLARPESSRAEIFLTLCEPFRPFPSASYLSSIIRRRMEELDLKVPAGVSRGSHGFRHALATRLTGRVPFKTIVDLLGHRDPSTTLLYSRVNPSALKQAALPWPGGEL